MRSLKLLAVSVGLVFASLLLVSCQGTPTRATSSIPQTPAAESRPTSPTTAGYANPYAECHH